VTYAVTFDLLDIATSCLDNMAILFLGWIVKTGLGDKLGPSKLRAGVNTDSSADAVSVYARGDIGLSTLSSLLVGLEKKNWTEFGKFAMGEE